MSDGRRIDGKRILVDYERGRTINGWLPKRMGGGKGETRRGNSEERRLHRKLDNEVMKERVEKHLA